MFGCFICELTFKDVTSLLRHIKLQHTLTAGNLYICKQKNCISEFQDVHAFKKHLNRKLDNDKVQYSYQPKHNDVALPVLQVVPDSLPESEHPQIKSALSRSQMQNVVEISAASFLATLYSESSMPRSQVQNIMNFSQEFLYSFLGILKEQVLTVTNCGATSENNEVKIEAMFDVCQNAFENLNTEYKRLKYFETKGHYIEPIPYIIGQTITSKTVRGVLKMIPTNVTGQFIPIRKVLQKFFEMPNTLDITLRYMEQLNNQNHSGTLSNIAQGKLWQKIKNKYNDKVVLPLIIYFDEYETNNPLGSHAGTHKLASVYFSIPVIPPQFQSKLQNIFLTLLFRNTDREEFGNKATFQPLIDELRDLDLRGFKHADGREIHVSCVLLTGDNLGIHQICGFVQSFSANYSCRFCQVTKTDLRKQTVESMNMLRKVDAYENELQKDNISLTGLREYCIWNDLPSFHVLENIACDIMHDVYEGVCRYDLSQLILYYIDNKYFTLDDLNNRISGFDFGPLRMGNRPPFISTSKLKNSTLGFSASETLTFVQHFGLIIGDLIPEDDEYWNLYLFLKEISDILNMNAIDIECIPYLKTIIQEHHETYINLFGETLKPKHHLLLHYPRIITMVGPLRNIWCMRFEAKHKPSKVAAHVSCSRINLPYSIAVKHQLEQCQRFWSQTGLLSQTEYGHEKLIMTENLPLSTQ